MTPRRVALAAAAALLVIAAALPLLAGDEDAAPRASDPEAEAMLAQVRARLDARNLFASARLVVRRGVRVRDLWVRLHLRGEGTTLARVEGPPREDGTTVLRTGGRVHVLFPRADLVVELPPGLWGDRLFGSDFAIDDLLAPCGDPSRFVSKLAGAETVAGAACRRIDLFPRTPRDALTGRTSVWLEEGTLALRRVEVFSTRGVRLRVVEAEGLTGAGFPRRLRATTEDRRGGTSELEFVYAESDPPIEDRYFTVEGLRLWR